MISITKETKRGKFIKVTCLRNGSRERIFWYVVFKLRLFGNEKQSKGIF